MNRMIEKVLWLFFLIGGLLACKQGNHFMLEGTISAAEGDTLYLEHRGLGGTERIDSLILKSDGSFQFKQPAPANPEFYQLRLGDQIASFAVDSLETLRLEADASDLYGTLTVKDSPTNRQLRQVDQLVDQAARKIRELEKMHETDLIDDVAFLAQLDTTLTNYKSAISKIILGSPSSAAAYYAVFQKINNYLIFDPYQRNDYPMFGAVATSWNSYYPDTERTLHLYQFTMNALKVRREEERKAHLLENVPLEDGSGLPDIVLVQVNGEKASLSTLKGKVVLLDFVVYDADFSPRHNMDLNTLYNQYSSRGFEIYQISFDSDEHFWKSSASNLPWITVRDPQSVNARLLSTYNVREIPTAFIINREGDVVKRIEDFTQLDHELAKWL